MLVSFPTIQGTPRSHYGASQLDLSQRPDVATSLDPIKFGEEHTRLAEGASTYLATAGHMHLVLEERTRSPEMTGRHPSST